MGAGNVQFTPISQTRPFSLYPNSVTFTPARQTNFQLFTPGSEYNRLPGSPENDESDSENVTDEDKESKALYTEAMLAAARRETEELENEMMTGICQAQTQDPNRSPNKRYPLDLENRPLHEVVHQLRLDLHQSWKDHCSKFDTQEQGYLGELSGRLDLENQLQSVIKVRNELEAGLEQKSETIRELESRLESLTLRHKYDSLNSNPGSEVGRNDALHEQLTYTRRQLDDIVAAKDRTDQKVVDMTENHRVELTALNEQLSRERSRAEFLEQQTKTQDRQIDDLRTSLKNAHVQIAQAQAAGDFRAQVEFLQNLLANEQARCSEAWKLVDAKETAVDQIRTELAATKDRLSVAQLAHSRETAETTERVSSLLTQLNAARAEVVASRDIRTRLEIDSNEYIERIADLEGQVEDLASAQLASPTELPSLSAVDRAVVDLLQDQLDKEKESRVALETEVSEQKAEIARQQAEIARHQAEISRLELVVAAEKEAVSKLQTEVVEARAAKAGVEAELARSKTSLAGTMAKFEAAKQELAACEETYSWNIRKLDHSHARAIDGIGQFVDGVRTARPEFEVGQAWRTLVRLAGREEAAGLDDVVVSALKATIERSSGAGAGPAVESKLASSSARHPLSAVNSSTLNGISNQTGSHTTTDTHPPSDPTSSSPPDTHLSHQLASANSHITNLTDKLDAQSVQLDTVRKEKNTALAAVAALQERVDAINRQVDKKVAALIRARDREWSARVGELGTGTGTGVGVGMGARSGSGSGSRSRNVVR